MKAPTLFMVMGYSGAGKDTIGDLIKAEIASQTVKFAAPGKRALEFMLQVEEGLLDDREKRIEVAPNCQGRTYLEVLMDFYHHRKLVIGEDLFTSQTVDKLKGFSHDNVDVVVTDCRSTDEGLAIVNLVEHGYFNLVTLWVVREGAKMLSTDTLQHGIYEDLCNYSDEHYVIYNKGTKEGLRDTLVDRGII